MTFFASDQICKDPARYRTYRAHRAPNRDRSGISRKKLAAVLVLLYEKGGELRVLLTTRSKLLRAHPGQTALPGGKADETDADLVHTAVRFPGLPPFLVRQFDAHLGLTV
jgi:hypothetical protein